MRQACFHSADTTLRGSAQLLVKRRRISPHHPKEQGHNQPLNSPIAQPKVHSPKVQDKHGENYHPQDNRKECLLTSS